MLVNLVKIRYDYTAGKYTLEEIAVNPDHVLLVCPEEKINQEIRVYESRRPPGLDARVVLSRITLKTGTSHTIVGDMNVITEKLNIAMTDKKTRKILRG